MPVIRLVWRGYEAAFASDRACCADPYAIGSDTRRDNRKRGNRLRARHCKCRGCCLRKGKRSPEAAARQLIQLIERAPRRIASGECSKQTRMPTQPDAGMGALAGSAWARNPF